MNRDKQRADITVVGVPEDGCMSLSSRAVSAVSSARVLAGHTRHREWFPQFNGLFLDMNQGFSAWISQVIDESEEGDVVVLASGDPLFFGIGASLLKKREPQALHFIPSLSSAQLAFSRLKMPWNDARFLSCHGRQLSGLVSQMQQADRFALLTDQSNSPQAIAKHLLKFNETLWSLSVCEQLGGPKERISHYDVEELANCEQSFDALNILVAERESPARWGGQGQFASDSQFNKRMPQKGLITKQSVRHLAITGLALKANDIMWDIGSGSGSVAIESAKLCWQGQVYAVECNPDCFPSLQNNIYAHATDNVTLITGKAPDALQQLPSPDAVFVGGSRGEMEQILTQAWQALNHNGRLMISAVTIDTVAQVYQWAKENALYMQTQVINISQTQPLAHYQRYQAENPIHLFTLHKKRDSNQSGATHE